MPQRDTLPYTVTVALILCVVCSLGVSAAAVLLRPRQEENKVLDRQRNILDATGIAYNETGKSASELTRKQVAEFYEVIEERLVDLETGMYTDEVDIETYDPQVAVKSGNADMIMQVGDTDYRLGIKEHERIARVYLVKDFNDPSMIRQVVLPVYGQGLWSTLYGYLALKRDLETVQGLTFYEHGETPGLGGEVDNANWKAQWVGRRIFDDEGRPALGVARGPAPQENLFLVDGITGATITSLGVTNLVRYWVSDNAFGPYLERLKRQLEGGEPVPYVNESDRGAAAEDTAADQPPTVTRTAPENTEPAE